MFLLPKPSPPLARAFRACLSLKYTHFLIPYYFTKNQGCNTTLPKDKISPFVQSEVVGENFNKGVG
jgi:hypothetical protein